MGSSHPDHRRRDGLSPEDDVRAFSSGATLFELGLRTKGSREALARGCVDGPVGPEVD